MLGATSHNLVALLTRRPEFANPYCETVSEVIIHRLGSSKTIFIFFYCQNHIFFKPYLLRSAPTGFSAAGNETGLSQVASGVGAGLIMYGVMFRGHSECHDD
jgi:hypothetical protein